MGQGDEALDGLAQTAGEDLRRGPVQWLRVGQLEARSDGDRESLDQESLSVVERGHRQGPQRTIGHEDQRVDLHCLEIRQDRQDYAGSVRNERKNFANAVHEELGEFAEHYSYPDWGYGYPYGYRYYRGGYWYD